MAGETPTFGSDQVLLYNVEPWNKLGFGVANFGRIVQTVNQPMHALADEIGKLQLFVMTRIDASREQYPSRNTVERLGKMLNRVFRVLNGRQKSAATLRVEEGHGTPAAQPWTLHPVPYFTGPIVRNPWLKQYNQLTMLALTNIYQHTDNNLALTITQEMASDILLYFQEMKLLLGMELLNIPAAELSATAFEFTDAHYAAYKPEQAIVRIEAIDTPGDVASRFTEEDLQPLLRGIPSSLIIPNLAKYPVGPLDNTFKGAKGEPTKDPAAVGTEGGEAVKPIV